MTGLRLVIRIKAHSCSSRRVAVANHTDVYVPAAFPDYKCVSRELNQAGSRRRRRTKFAEQAMFFLTDPGTKIKRVHVAARAAVANGERPKLVNHDAITVLVLYRAEERAGRRIVGVDGRVPRAEIADDERAAEDAERCGREDDAPRRVECAVIDAEGQIAHTVGVEAADEAVPDTFLVKAGHGVHLRIEDVERTAYGLDVESVISVPHCCRDGRIDKRKTGGGLQGEGRVINVDCSVREVGRINKIADAVVSEGKSGIDMPRMTGRNDTSGRTGRRSIRVPTRNVSRDRSKEETSYTRRRSTRSGQHEVSRGRVGNRPGRQTARNRYRLRTRVEHDGRARRQVAADELCRTRPVVGDPEGAARGHRDPPGIDQQWIE